MYNPNYKAETAFARKCINKKLEQLDNGIVMYKENNLRGHSCFLI